MIREEDIVKLKELGVKDSKKLSKNKRTQLFEPLKKLAVNYVITIVKPEEIDHAVNSLSNNLNWLEATKTAMILNKLKPDKAIIDSPSHNLQAYKDYLLHYIINKKIILDVRNKAEQMLPVAAASIMAKVVRDDEIEKIKRKVGDFGSGYPSDPKTKKFLENNWSKFHEIFRKSWSTYKNVSGSNQALQKKLNSFLKNKS